MSNFIHANTDGPFNPYSKVYDLATVKKDFPAFQLEKSYQDHMHAPPLPVSFLEPLAGVLRLASLGTLGNLKPSKHRATSPVMSEHVRDVETRSMGNNRLRIMSIVGARPNMMKIAPLLAELRQHEDIEPVLVHTGQHYDYSMSPGFLRSVAPAASRLQPGSRIRQSTTHRKPQRLCASLESWSNLDRPDMVLVAGDVNSTVACALVAAKERIPVAHVEAGLRSFDRTMPEELNRILTDTLSDLLFYHRGKRQPEPVERGSRPRQGLLRRQSND